MSKPTASDNNSLYIGYPVHPWSLLKLWAFLSAFFSIAFIEPLKEHTSV
jgi:hypothetical protein